MAENPSVGKEASLDLARELLISISESLPDKLLEEESLPGNFPSSVCDKETTNDHVGASETVADENEQLRSELISISYVPSPGKVTLPANGHL